MKTVILDCTPMVDEKSVHDTFAAALDFPASYGRNLDALYDMLTSCGELELKLVNTQAIAKLFRYGDNLMLTLKDAEKDNPYFTLVAED